MFKIPSSKRPERSTMPEKPNIIPKSQHIAPEHPGKCIRDKNLVELSQKITEVLECARKTGMRIKIKIEN